MNFLDEYPEPASILGTVLEACRSFVLVCDVNGAVDYANPAALKLFGRAEPAFERDGLFEMATTKKDRQLLRKTAMNLQLNERKRMDMVLNSADGLYVACMPSAYRTTSSWIAEMEKSSSCFPCCRA